MFPQRYSVRRKIARRGESEREREDAEETKEEAAKRRKERR